MTENVHADEKLTAFLELEAVIFTRSIHKFKLLTHDPAVSRVAW